jgi:hypothetical protein
MQLVALVSIVACGTAYAGHGYSETDGDKAEDVLVLAADVATQWEGSFGLRIGTFHTASVYNEAFGVGLAGGVRHDRYAVIGEYTLLHLSESDSTWTGPPDVRAAYAIGQSDPWTRPSGIAQRFGVMGRYNVLHGVAAATGQGIFGGLYVEAGVGEQLIRWSGGGYLHRPDLGLGMGVQVGGRGSQHHGGVTFGFRATLTAPPANSEPNTVTCAGPCDGPTGPIGIDRSFLFTFDMIFGS